MDPAPATTGTFAHMDATTVLSRSIAELGIYPAVDPLDSKSLQVLLPSWATSLLVFLRCRAASTRASFFFFFSFIFSLITYLKASMLAACCALLVRPCLPLPHHSLLDGRETRCWLHAKCWRSRTTRVHRPGASASAGMRGAVGASLWSCGRGGRQCRALLGLGVAARVRADECGPGFFSIFSRAFALTPSPSIAHTFPPGPGNLHVLGTTHVSRCRLMSLCMLALHGVGSPSPIELEHILHRHPALQHLRLSDYHHALCLVPYLSSFRGCPTTAASILPGRPVQVLGLVGGCGCELVTTVEEDLARITAGSVLVRMLECSCECRHVSARARAGYANASVKCRVPLRA
jgi:hypothetical protein